MATHQLSQPQRAQQRSTRRWSLQGSTDGSGDLARGAGARLVQEPRRGSGIFIDMDHCMRHALDASVAVPAARHSGNTSTST